MTDNQTPVSLFEHMGTDARKWAEEWTKAARTRYERDGVTALIGTQHGQAPGWITVWFTKAIEAGQTPVPSPRPPTLVQELATVLNRHSAENGSNTPDFLLAEYLLRCLEAFNIASRRREEWFGQSLTIAYEPDPALEPELCPRCGGTGQITPIPGGDPIPCPGCTQVPQ